MSAIVVGQTNTQSFGLYTDHAGLARIDTDDAPAWDGLQDVICVMAREARKNLDIRHAVEAKPGYSGLVAVPASEPPSYTSK